MAQHNFNDGSAFEQSDYEYDVDTIPTEFIKVEHIYDILSDDFSEPDEPYDDVTCEDPVQPISSEKDPLAPDPEADVAPSVEVMPTNLLEIKMEPSDEPEKDAEEMKHQEINGDAAAVEAAEAAEVAEAGTSPAPAFDDDTSQSSARITRSHLKQSSQPDYTEVNETGLQETRAEVECNLCGMTFGWKSSLYRHKRRKHRSKQKGKELSKSAAKINPVSSVLEATKLATNKTCTDKEVAQSCVPQAEKIDIIIPQQTSLISDGNNQGSKRLILDHLRRHNARHQCNLCSRKFSSMWHLDRHVNSHPVMKPFRCPLCEKSFVWERNLKVHLCVHMKESDHQSVGKKIHESAQVVPKTKSISGAKAVEVKAAVSEASLVSEQIIRNESLCKMQCSICSKRFTQLGVLKRHMRIHSNIKPFSCPVCGKAFSRKDGLQNHRNWHCNNTNMKVKKKQNVSSEKIDDSKEKASENSHERNLATECVPEKSMAREVQDETTEVNTTRRSQQVETQDNPVETNDSTVSCSSQVTKEQYRCIMCAKETNSKAAMLAHMQIHMGGSQTQCSICGKQVNNLPRHMLLHTGEKLFQCTVCEKKFSRREYILKHELTCTQKTVHDIKQRDTQHDIRRQTKKVRRQCPICQKVLIGCYLKQHLRIHSGTKPFQCRFCSRTFRFESGYQKHLKSHKMMIQETLKDQTTKEETIQNTTNKEIVNDNVSEKQVLEKHECSVCGKYLNSKAALLCHELRHEGKGNSICNICDKKLYSSKSLLSHMRTHTGEKPFECGVCKKKFAWRTSRKKHYKLHIQRNNLMFDKGQSKHPQMSERYVEDKCSDLKVTEIISSGNLKETKKGNSFHSQMVTISKVKQKHQNINKKKFQCKVCDKIIFTKINFFIHMQSHSREETFSCLICHKVFSRPETLKIHMKSHAQISNKKSVKESSGINSKKQKGKVYTEEEEELCTFPKDILSHKPTQSRKISSNDSQMDNSFLMNQSEVFNSSGLEMEKLLDKNVLHDIDSKICDTDVILVDTNQSVLQGNTSSQGQYSRRKRLPSQGQETEQFSASTSQSFEKRGEIMQSDAKTYEENSSKGADANNKSLACELCGKVFSQQPRLLRHMMNQSCLRQFECNLCHKKYSSKGRLDEHMLLHSEDSSKCDSGEKARPPLQPLQEPEIIIIHSRSPSPEKVIENVSQDTQRFDKCEDLHSMMVSNVEEKHNNENMVINFTSSNKTPLEKLADTAQPTAAVSRDINLCDASHFAENRKPSDNKVSSLENKVPVIVNSPRKICRPEIADIDVSEVNKHFECVLCKLTFDTQRALLSHSQIHDKNRESRLKCKFCPKRFTCETTRRNHLRMHETNPRCNSKTRADNEDPTNTERIEITERCAMKGKNTWDENLRSMIQIQRIEQMEQCKVCSEKYNSKDLVKHMSIHTGGISFQCGLCDQMFSTETVIQNHVKKHDQKITIYFLCHMCGRTLTSPRALTDHVQSHTEPPKLCCRVCGEDFSDSFQLQVHVKRHSGEKPFRCKFCRKRFALKINQLKHLNEHYKRKRVISTKAAENQSVMSKERATVECGIQLVKDFERKVGELALEEQRQKQFLEAKPADNCISVSSTEVRNKGNNLGSLTDAEITSQTVGITQEMNKTGNSVTSNSSISEISSTTRGMTTDSPTIVRLLGKSVVTTRTSPCDVEDNHKRKCLVQSDEAQKIKEALGMSRLDVEIESIYDIPKQDKQQVRPVADNVNIGALAPERLLGGGKGDTRETSQRKTGAHPLERSVNNALAGSNLEFNDTAHISAPKLLDNSAMKNDARSKHLISEWKIPMSLEVKISENSSISANTNRNDHGLGLQVSGEAVQTAQNKLQMDVSVCDVALRIPENRKHDERLPETPTSRRHFSYKLDMQKGKVSNGPKLSSNNPVVNCRVPADTVIRGEVISKKVQDDEVEIVQETLGDRNFSLKPVNLEKKSTGPLTVKEFWGDIIREEITEAVDSRFAQNNARKNCRQPADVTISREPLSVESCIKSQDDGPAGSSILPGNRRHDDVRSVESKAMRTTVTKNVGVVEIVDLESENEESPSPSSIPPRTIPQWTVADERAQERGCSQSEETTYARVAQQMEATEFSSSYLPRRQLPSSARTELAAEMNLDTHVGRQIDTYAAAKAGELAHAFSTPLTQSVLEKHQLALQSRFQMPDTWKETAVRPHPDYRGHGNSFHSIDPLLFAQPPGPWYGVPSTNYTPTHGGFYGWVPPTPSYQAISSSNSVFMTKLPPPYPGNNIYKNYPPPTYSDAHLMQFVSSHGGEAMNIPNNNKNNKEDRRPRMP